MPVWFQPIPMSKPIAFDLNRMQYNVNLDTFEPMDPFFAASRRLSTDMTDNTQPLVPIRAPLVRRPGSSCSISSTSSESTVVPPIHNKNYQESRYKTELCRHFEENGTCPHGTQCLFAHGLTELRPFRGRHRKFKTQLCKAFHSDGFCSFGPRCSYVHTGADVIPALVQQHKDRFANKLDNSLFQRPAMARENAIPIQMPPKVQTRDSELALAAQMRLSVFANICNN